MSATGESPAADAPRETSSSAAAAAPAPGGAARRRPPRPLVTLAILAANAVVFAITSAATGTLFEPTAEGALRWGANYGPLTLAGDGWRIASCAFVHFGILHLAFNMYALFGAGALVERALGRAAFAGIYVVSALAGSVASLAWDPYIVSAGASGAVFGVYGALTVLWLARAPGLAGVHAKALGASLVLFLGYNLIPRPGIDEGAHVGGLCGGAAVALALVFPRRGAVPGRARTATVCAAALALVLAGFAAMPSPLARYEHAIATFHEVEQRTIAKANGALEALRAGRIDELALADLLEREVLPAWNAAAAALDDLGRLPEEVEKRAGLLREYARLRALGWAELATACRAYDTPAIARANRRQREAEDVIQELAKLPR